MPSYLNHQFFDPVNPPTSLDLSYPRFVGEAGDVGRTCGVENNAEDVGNDAGDVDGLV